MDCLKNTEQVKEVLVNNSQSGSIPKEFIVREVHISEENLKEFYCFICGKFP